MRRRTKVAVILLTVLAALGAGLIAGHEVAATPSLPAVSGLYSLNHSDPAKWYSHRRVTIAWPSLAGVAGYSYALDRDTATVPDGRLDPSGAPGFSPAVRYATDPQPCGVAVGDFNGDGRPDLAVLADDDSEKEPFPGRLSIWLNDGSDKFARSTDIMTGAIPAGLAVGDLNVDGKQDVVVADYGAGVTVCLGDGAGHLGAARTYKTGAGPNAVAIADMNGDSKPDLVTANADGYSVSVLLGAGDGGFAPKIDHATGRYPEALVIADCDGDGKPDVATANAFGYSITVLRGGGDGSSPLAGTTKPGGPPSRSRPPTSTATASWTSPTEAGDKVSVRLGDGSGEFGAHDPTRPGPARAVAVADITGDGHPDLIAGTGGNTVSVLPGDGSGKFAPATQFVAGPRTTDRGDPSLAVADFDGDGRTDLAFTNGLFNRLYIYRSELGRPVTRPPTVSGISICAPPMAGAAWGRRRRSRCGSTRGGRRPTRGLPRCLGGRSPPCAAPCATRSRARGAGYGPRCRWWTATRTSSASSSTLARRSAPSPPRSAAPCLGGPTAIASAPPMPQGTMSKAAWSTLIVR